MKKNNKNTGMLLATIGAIGIASLVTVAGFAVKGLKKNLVNDLNEFDFGSFKNSFKKGCDSGVCQDCKDDYSDEVLRYRKERYYKRQGIY